MCDAFGVTRQGYYAWRKALHGPRMRRRTALKRQVSETFGASRQTYGSPRLHRQLRADGLRVSKKTVEKTMRELGLVARRKKSFRATTRQDPAHPKAENVLNRRFSAAGPDSAWVTDITYIRLENSWAYLAVIIDLYSRAVVGWSLSSSQTTELPIVALYNAVKRRQPKGQLIHHSDRGCQYTSDAYRTALSELGIIVSMSRTGNCWDNAVAESFFSTLKNELIHRTQWHNLPQLRAALFDYIEVFYNRQRIHSTLNYQTPTQVLENFERVA